mmetsp:Transcript_10739/g.22787  ORF Transcript_10739/g.22787 Transcript_10739/m.22787 type:complete len:108 (-) Transcript_10739:1416-1739(-)
MITLRMGERKTPWIYRGSLRRDKEMRCGNLHYEFRRMTEELEGDMRHQERLTMLTTVETIKRIDLNPLQQSDTEPEGKIGQQENRKGIAETIKQFGLNPTRQNDNEL